MKILVSLSILINIAFVVLYFTRKAPKAEKNKIIVPTAEIEVVIGEPPEEVPDRYLYLYSGGYGKDEKESILKSFKFSKIEFEKTPCFGECPVFVLTLHSDGTVNYKGEMYVKKLGTYETNAGLFNFGRISYYIEDQGILNLKDDYSANWTCDSSTLIRIYDKNDNLIKGISDYGSFSPVKLQILFEAINAIAIDSEIWKDAEKLNSKSDAKK